jgi:AcrR family transcriptional regulator
LGQEPGTQAAPAWQWSRTEQTQQVLLQAAREVFAEQGFASAKMTDIAARAGLSVGSIYHHFGGKNELYLALWRRYHLAREEAADQAVTRVRQAGVTDSGQLWAAGARAVLQVTWKRRDVALLFCAGNGPPDFEDLRRHRRAGPGRHGDALLYLAGDTAGGLYAAVLAALISEGARAVATAATRHRADAVIGDVLEYARRLMAGGPASSSHSGSGAPQEALGPALRERRRSSVDSGV